MEQHQIEIEAEQYQAERARFFRMRKKHVEIYVRDKRLSYAPEEPAELYAMAIRDWIKRGAAIKKAKAIGLAYWPALAYGPSIDPAAYKLAEDIRGSLESYKNPYHLWAMSGWDVLRPDFVARAWFNAGCKASDKFRLQIREQILIPKNVNNKNARFWLKGYYWCMKNVRFCTPDHRVMTLLGKLSPEMRWAAIHGRERVVTKKDLNYQAMVDVQRSKRIMHRWKYAPVSSLWWELKDHGIPEGLEGVKPGFPEKKYQEIHTWVAGEKDDLSKDECIRGIRRPIYNLSRLFCLKDVQKMLGTSVADPTEVHDLGQFRDFGNADIKKWKALCLKFGSEILNGSHFWEYIEKEGQIPSSLREFREAVKKCIAVRCDCGALAEACVLSGMSEGEIEWYKTYWESLLLKKAVSIPHVVIEDESVPGYSLDTLGDHDPVGPVLGLIVPCCQHPSGAASSCASAIVEDVNSSAWVVRYRGRIVAQSYLYRNGGTLVIDSVEALDNAYVEGIAKLYLRAAKAVVGRFGIEHVHIGCTTYGITQDVENSLVTEETHPVSNTLSWKVYTDASQQRRIVL